MENYSLSDITSAVKGAEGSEGFGGSWFLIILFLFVFMGGGGLFGNQNARNCATTEDVQNQFNFSALERQNNETVAAIRQGVYDITATTKDLAFNNNTAIREVGMQVAQLQPALDNCCCNILRANDQTRFDLANYAANIEKTSILNTQKILDAMQGNRMADMQNQINQLQLQANLCGVVRYPTAITYNGGASPFCCNNSCGC